MKLDSRDLYAFGAHRGGIDERWFASTTPAMNEGRTPDEGLSYVVFEGGRVTLKDAVEEEGARLVGQEIWETYHRWPVYSKFFDNFGPLPFHLHQNDAQAKLVGREGKPEGYYFPPQLNATHGTFPHTYFGLEPGTSKEEIKDCLTRWEQGDNGILDYAKAYRLKPGTGWFVPPGVLHAPGSLLTYEPQWGSDVLSMFQSMVDGREIKHDLLLQDVPEDRHQDLDFLVSLVDWPANVDPTFKQNHYLEPILAGGSKEEGYFDRWVVYARMDGRIRFSAKELTVLPGSECTIRDHGAFGLIVTQGRGSIGKLPVSSPASIRFGEMTEDELFVSHEASTSGIVFKNESQTEPLVTLRYFGPVKNPKMPNIGDHRLRNKE